MREILFRAKKHGSGEWVYGYLVKRPSAAQWGDNGGPWYIDVPPVDPDDSYKNYNVDPETVGQYTGIRDKNGKRIFEGDIVKQNFEKHIDNPCVFDDFRGFVVGVVSITGRGTFIKPAYGELYIEEEKEQDYRPQRKRLISYRAEVLGNIHDNPELLQEVKEHEAD